jgi:hypothetical protein
MCAYIAYIAYSLHTLNFVAWRAIVQRRAFWNTYNTILFAVCLLSDTDDYPIDP